MNQQTSRIYLYTRFERFWHWTQAAFIIVLGLTGYEAHGTYKLFGFKQAVDIHNFVAIAWFVLYAFVIFWHATTSEWRHYIPTTKMLFQVARYYAYGIFKGEEHPVPKSERNKHNPLQRLTYLGLSIFLIPFQMVTGFLYFMYNSWADLGIRHWSLGTVAVLHTIGAFALLVFLIVHTYMTTTGHHVSAHLKAMWTGWEEVPVRDEANGRV